MLASIFRRGVIRNLKSGFRVCFVEIIIANVLALFRHSPPPGANDEKVGRLRLLPRVAAASSFAKATEDRSQPDPGLSSFALSRLKTEEPMLPTEQVFSALGFWISLHTEVVSHK